jgi:hypothetical protein
MQAPGTAAGALGELEYPKDVEGGVVRGLLQGRLQGRERGRRTTGALRLSPSDLRVTTRRRF